MKKKSLGVRKKVRTRLLLVKKSHGKAKGKRSILTFEKKLTYIRKEGEN